MRRDERLAVDVVIDCEVDPVELHADMARSFDGIGDMLKLMDSYRQLQQYNRQHSEPRQAPPLQ